MRWKSDAFRKYIRLSNIPIVVVSVVNPGTTGIGMAAFFTLVSRAFGRSILFAHALSGEGFSYAVLMMQGQGFRLLLTLNCIIKHAYNITLSAILCASGPYSLVISISRFTTYFAFIVNLVICPHLFCDICNFICVNIIYLDIIYQ